MRRIGFSREDIDEVVETEDVSALPVEEVAADTELQEGADDIAADVAAIEDAEQTLPQLEEQQEFVEGAIEEGDGLNEREAENVVATVEHICDRLGVAGLSMSSSARESFGSASGRLTASKMVAEGIKDRVVEMWERFLAYVRSTWEKIKKWIAGLFDMQKRYQNRLEDLLKQADKISGTPAKDKVSVGQMLRSIGEKPEVCLDAHTKLTSKVDGYFKVCKESAAGAQKELEGVLVSGQKATEDVKKFLTDLCGKIDKSISGGSATKYGPLYSGIYAKVNKEKAGEYSVASIDFAEEKAFDNLDKASQAAPAKQGEVKTVLNSVGGLLKANAELTKSSSGIDAFAKDIDKAISACVDFIVKSKQDDEQSAKESLLCIRTFYSSMNTSLSKLSTRLPSMNMKAANAGLNWAAVNIAAYKQAK